MKQIFIKNEIFILTIMAAFGRNNIYDDKAAESEKKLFREKVKTLLFELEEKYKSGIDEVDHLKNLSNLQAKLEEAGSGVLKESTISFGTVQKLLNLYLKYSWCLNWIAEPPHCPIDRIILSKMKDEKLISQVPSWTKMEEDEYCRIIEKIRSSKNCVSIAQWELNEFRRN